MVEVGCDVEVLVVLAELDAFRLETAWFEVPLVTDEVAGLLIVVELEPACCKVVLWLLLAETCGCELFT